MVWLVGATVGVQDACVGGSPVLTSRIKTCPEVVPDLRAPTLSPVLGIDLLQVGRDILTSDRHLARTGAMDETLAKLSKIILFCIAILTFAYTLGKKFRRSVIDLSRTSLSQEVHHLVIRVWNAPTVVTIRKLLSLWKHGFQMHRPDPLLTGLLILLLVAVLRYLMELSPWAPTSVTWQLVLFAPLGASWFWLFSDSSVSILSRLSFTGAYLGTVWASSQLADLWYSGRALGIMAGLGLLALGIPTTGPRVLDLLKELGNTPQTIGLVSAICLAVVLLGYLTHRSDPGETLQLGALRLAFATAVAVLTFIGLWAARRFVWRSAGGTHPFPMILVFELASLAILDVLVWRYLEDQ